jgi:hypothetical protein
MLRATVVLVILGSMDAAACTCVSAVNATAKTPMADAWSVFRGTVIESKLLPQHPEMGGRRRYEVIFRVNRIWKGDPSQTVTLHEVDPGTDCMGGIYEVGKEYLVYAMSSSARDFTLPDGKLWIGWTDVLKPGTPILQTMACTMSGLTSEPGVQHALDQLGRGSPPPKEK